MSVLSRKFPSRCGSDCGECKYAEQMNCPGCIEASGEVFWGTCALATCCVERGLQHCGMCSEFPCETLREYAYDEKQGDDGQRIRNLEQWNKMQ